MHDTLPTWDNTDQDCVDHLNETIYAFLSIVFSPGRLLQGAFVHILIICGWYYGSTSYAWMEFFHASVYYLAAWATEMAFIRVKSDFTNKCH